MKVNDFYSILETEMEDSQNINISVTKAKGIITLFWSTTFIKHSYTEWFNKHFDEINWANQKIVQIGKKYPNLYHSHTIVTQRDVEHFDHLLETEKPTPVKRSWQTDSLSFGGAVRFNYPKE